MKSLEVQLEEVLGVGDGLQTESKEVQTSRLEPEGEEGKGGGGKSDGGIRIESQETGDTTSLCAFPLRSHLPQTPSFWPPIPMIIRGPPEQSGVLSPS